jgi:hypothetical protein
MTPIEHLISFINNPPERTPGYEALRIVAYYLAKKAPRDIGLEELMNVVKAHNVFTQLAKSAHKKTQPVVGPFMGGKDTSAAKRWEHAFAFLDVLEGKKLSHDERAAQNLFLYMREEQQDKGLLGKRWSPRLRLCASPRCEKLVYDKSVNRSLKTCSNACQMAWLRAQ